MTKAVFFDLDGTLADTAPDLGGALNQLLAEHDRPAVPADAFRPYVSSGSRGMLRVGFGLKPDDPDYPRLQTRFLEIYEGRLCTDTHLFAGMAALLDRLEQLDIVWGIVTNKPERFTLPLVAQLGLERRAATVVSGDSAPRPKPAPDTLLLACRLTGVEPDTAIYVGDDLRDIQAARAAGMKAIAAAYGYLGDGPHVAEWGADSLIHDPLQLLTLL